MNAGIDFPATRAFIAEVAGRRFGAVEGFRNHQRARSFSDAFGSGENQPMREAAFAQFCAKAVNDPAISDEGFERHCLLAAPYRACIRSAHQSNPRSVRMCRWTASMGRSA